VASTREPDDIAPSTYGSTASLDINGSVGGGAVTAAPRTARCTFNGGIHCRDECGAGDDVGCAATESDCCPIRNTETAEPVVSNAGRFSEINAGS
jgi:hypothetical protein